MAEHIGTPLVTILGPPGSALGYAIRDFLYRSDVPFEWVPLASDTQARAAAGVEHLADTRLPVCVFADGTRLECPTVRQIIEQAGKIIFHALGDSGASNAGKYAGELRVAELLQLLAIHLLVGD